MLPWLLKQLNVTDDLIHHLDQVVFAFHYTWVLWVGLPLLVPIAWFVYTWQRRHLPSAPAFLCAILTLTRVLILGVLVLVLAGPHLKLEYTVQQKPIVAVLFDQSQSMELPAGPFETDEDLSRIAAAAGYQTSDGAPDPETRKALNSHRPRQAGPDRSADQRPAAHRSAGEEIRPSLLRFLQKPATDRRQPRQAGVPRSAAPRRRRHADRRRP